jgi:hypothetical protein
LTASFSRSTYRFCIIRRSTGIGRFAPVIIGWPGVVIVYRSRVIIDYRSVDVWLNYDGIVVWPVISIPVVVWSGIVDYRFV